jgi:HSP20 family molecular chaperone IbpA
MSFIMDDTFPSGLRTPKTTGCVSPPNRINKPQQEGAAGPATMSVMSMKEDDDSIRLTMDLPGVRARDMEVSVQRGVLSIRGYRCVKGMDNRVVKKQKLSRRFAVDTDVVDVTRASANIANGVLVICAPKKCKPITIKIPVTNDPDFDIEDELRRASLSLKEGTQVSPAVVKKEHEESVIESIAPPVIKEVTFPPAPSKP